MSQANMTSLQRVLTTLSHKEPDRVPFFLLLTMHGAKELGLTIKDYFSTAENVAEGQLRLRNKYKHDCLFNFYYAPLEIEAWGGEVIFHEDGPPNSGRPFLKSFDDIKDLDIPDVGNTPSLQKILESGRILKNTIGDQAPIIGVVMSPFSLPVMQLGFDKYIELIYEQPDIFNHLMDINEQFCVSWANAQLESGATAICYFDPVSSPTILPRDIYLKTGFEIAKRTIAKINGPTATHFASGRCLPIVDDIAETGTAIIGVSKEEDISQLKERCRDRLTILGNMNGIEMRRWTKEDAEREVKALIAQAGQGGGFILADNHGEIPFQVSDEILTTISETVHTWGTYPLVQSSI